MLDAAFDLFAEQGYQATTIAAVAERAGVAVQTVYFTFHNKATLFWDMAVARRAGDDGADEVMQMQWVGQAFAEPDQRRTVALIAEHATDIFVRLAPVASAMTVAAAIDPDIAERVEMTNKQRREGMTAMMTALSAKGPPLAVDVAHAVDVVDVLQSLATYSSFTVGCGWSDEEFKAWTYRSLTQLLEPLTPARARKADLAATQGLSYQTLITTGRERIEPPQRQGGTP